MVKASFEQALTNLSREACSNWTESINLRLRRLKEMYFSILFGMQVTWPSSWLMAFMMRWESYSLRLWKTTGMCIFTTLNLSFRLQVLWAARTPVLTRDVAMVSHAVPV
jgi:hypothetical protein